MERTGRSMRTEHQEYRRPPDGPIHLSINITPLFWQEDVQFAAPLGFSDTPRLHQLERGLEAAQGSLATTIEERRRQSEESTDHRRYAESVLRSIDARIIVMDHNIRLRFGNGWNENAWSLRSEEVLGADLQVCDIGLPALRLRKHRQAAQSGAEGPRELKVEGIDQRDRGIRCRVRLFPLFYDGMRRPVFSIQRRSALPWSTKGRRRGLAARRTSFCR